VRVGRREIGVRYSEHLTVYTVIRNSGRPHERLSTKANEGIRLARQPTAEDPFLDRSLLEIFTGK
jgi:hypothetical protein